METTGIYHLDLAIALYDARVKLIVVNPNASHHFAKVLMKNSKTDAVDVDTLAEYAERMGFVPGHDHAIHRMLTQDKPFDNSRFYALPA